MKTGVLFYIEVWCKGSTADFESVSVGSIPTTSATFHLFGIEDEKEQDIKNRTEPGQQMIMKGWYKTMKKEEFVKLGLDEELAAKCETASLDELKGYIPKARFDEVNNEKKKLELDVRERDTQLENLKNSSGDVEDLKQQIATLQDENKAKDDAHAAEIKQLKVDSAVEAALTGAKAKNAVAVKALLTGLDKAELLEDGTIKGLAEQIEALKKSDSYLFEAKEGKKGVKGAEPGESGNDEGDKGVDTSKMTYSELVAYMAENPDAKI